MPYHQSVLETTLEFKKEIYLPFLNATCPRGSSIKYGARLSAAASHVVEQKSELSPIFVAFQHIKHDVHVAELMAAFTVRNPSEIMDMIDKVKETDSLILRCRDTSCHIEETFCHS